MLPQRWIRWRRRQVPHVFASGKRVSGVARSTASPAKFGSGLQMTTASPNKSVNTDAQGRPATAPRLSLVAGYVRRYEGMALSAYSGKTFRLRTARVRCLGVPAGSLFWGWHGRRSLLTRYNAFGAGRSSRAVAPASLAQVVGASLSGAQSFWAAASALGAKVAFKPTWSAQPGAMPPCSFQHRRASATASHNKSMHTDTQVLAAARLRFPGAGDFRRYMAQEAALLPS